jgi:ribosomal protein S18 acetylase RimI-like enzyme
MAWSIERAQPRDVDALLDLYNVAYDGHYTLPLGTQRQAALAVIHDSESLWLVGRDSECPDRLEVSAVCERDRLSGMYKLEGVVVAPDFRGRGLSEEIIREAIGRLEASPEGEASFLSTVRTRGYGAQAMVLKNGFRPSGLLPNAHRLDTLEFHIVMMRLSAARLARRRLPGPLAPELIPLLEQVDRTWLQSERRYAIDFEIRAQAPLPKGYWEFTKDETLVRQGFEALRARGSNCVPWGTPNFVAKAAHSSQEVYLWVEAHCAAVVLGYSPLSRDPASLLTELRESFPALRIPSLQVLLPVDATADVRRFLRAGFLASAVLPAYLQEANAYRDAVLLALAPEPLESAGVRLAPVVAPFVRDFAAGRERRQPETRASTIHGNFPPGFSAGGPM